MNVSVCVVGGGDACEYVCGGGRGCTGSHSNRF